jgi:hypothetical protein
MSNQTERPTKIEQVYLQDLKPYEKNPRKHGKGIDELVKSITRNGFTNPIMIDQNGRIIAGHGRYQAAKRLNLTTVPCIRFNVDDKQYHEILISDNKISELSKWDNKILQETMLILGDLKDMEIPGFSLDEIDKVFGHSHNDVSMTKDAEADFGDAGSVESTQDDRSLVKRKTFMFTNKEYKFVDEKLKAVKKEHGFDTEVEALIEVLKSVKSLTKVVTKKGAVKDIEVEND